MLNDDEAKTTPEFDRAFGAESSRRIAWHVQMKRRFPKLVAHLSYGELGLAMAFAEAVGLKPEEAIAKMRAELAKRVP